MLPRKLSNGICSLNPNVERLAMTCEMEISPDGEVLSHKIYPSVIESNARMTYNDVNKILEENHRALPRFSANVWNDGQVAQVAVEAP